MKLQPVAGTSNCAGKHCPTIYKTDRGSFVVQGNSIGSSELPGVLIADHEGAVEIPEALVRDLVSKLTK